MQKLVWCMALSLVGFALVAPTASASGEIPPLATPVCEDILDEDYCNGPEGTCRSVFADGICNMLFDPLRLLALT